MDTDKKNQSSQISPEQIRLFAEAGNFKPLIALSEDPQQINFLDDQGCSLLMWSLRPLNLLKITKRQRQLARSDQSKLQEILIEKHLEAINSNGQFHPLLNFHYSDNNGVNALTLAAATQNAPAAQQLMMFGIDAQNVITTLERKLTEADKKIQKKEQSIKVFDQAISRASSTETNNAIVNAHIQITTNKFIFFRQQDRHILTAHRAMKRYLSEALRFLKSQLKKYHQKNSGSSISSLSDKSKLASDDLDLSTARSLVQQSNLQQLQTYIAKFPAALTSIEYRDKYSLLSLAMSREEGAEKTQIILWLLSETLRKAPELLHHQNKRNGASPLSLAIANNADNQIIKALLDAGANIHLKDAHTNKKKKWHSPYERSQSACPRIKALIEEHAQKLLRVKTYSSIIVPEYVIAFMGLVESTANNKPGESNIYLVGGAVLKHLLNQHFNYKLKLEDYDFIIKANPQNIKAILSSLEKADYKNLSAKNSQRHTFYTIEAPNGDVFDVMFTRANETLLQNTCPRDLKINAFYARLDHKHKNTLIISDPLNALSNLPKQQDKEPGQLIPINEKTFFEDPVRILRTLSMEIILGFKPSNWLSSALKNEGPQNLSNWSAVEQKPKPGYRSKKRGDFIFKFFSTPGKLVCALSTLEYYNLFFALFPETNDFSNDEKSEYLPALKTAFSQIEIAAKACRTSPSKTAVFLHSLLALMCITQQIKLKQQTPILERWKRLLSYRTASERKQLQNHPLRKVILSHLQERNSSASPQKQMPTFFQPPPAKRQETFASMLQRAQSAS